MKYLFLLFFLVSCTNEEAERFRGPTTSLPYPKYGQEVKFKSEFYGVCTGKLEKCFDAYQCRHCFVTDVSCTTGYKKDMKTYLNRYIEEDCPYHGHGESL